MALVETDSDNSVSDRKNFCIVFLHFNLENSNPEWRDRDRHIRIARAASRSNGGPKALVNAAKFTAAPPRIAALAEWI
jgi:hypothetical protein